MLKMRSGREQDIGSSNKQERTARSKQERHRRFSDQHSVQLPDLPRNLKCLEEILWGNVSLKENPMKPVEEWCNLPIHTLEFQLRDHKDLNLL
jgi:hypothetical protein